MQSNTNVVLNAISTLLNEGYTYRTAKAIATKAKTTEAVVLGIAREYGYDTSKKRGSDCAELIGLAGVSKNDNAVVAAISGTLMDTRYTYRTAKAIAKAAAVDHGIVLEVADEFGYNLSKKRRRDSAQLIGL